MLVYYGSDTGLGIYAQFDDDADTRIQATEGEADKLRRYEVPDGQIIDAGLAAGIYSVTFREGDADNPNDDDYIYSVVEFVWTGTAEYAISTSLNTVKAKTDQLTFTTPNQVDATASVDLSPSDVNVIAEAVAIAVSEQGMPSGGGSLSARIGIVSLSAQDYLEIVQGEQKIITFIVEAHGRFVLESFDEIVVKFADAEDTVIIKTEADSIVRVCEALDVQVLRCTLSEEDTLLLVEGLLKIEIAFDSQKARLTHSVKIITAITSEES